MKQYYLKHINPIKEKVYGLARKVEPKTLFLVLERVYFNQIIEGTKDIEYRENKAFYQSRLIRNDEFRNFKLVLFQEGCHKSARKMTVEINKIVLHDGIFEIHLGKILGKDF